MDFYDIAQSYMGRTIYEQRDLEAQYGVEDKDEVDEGLVDLVKGGDEGDVDSDIDPDVDGDVDVAGDEGDVDGDADEMISIDDFRKAVELIQSGEAEDADDALAQVRASAGDEDGEGEGDVGGEDDDTIPTDVEEDVDPVSTEDDESDGEFEESFLSYVKKYL